MRKNLTLPFIFFCTLFLFTPQIEARVWYQKATIGGDARHRATAFSIGTKGYYGGGHINSGGMVTYKDYWQYDPGTNTWTQIADFGGGYRYHSSAFTINKTAYVGGGENATSDYTKDFWKYIPEVNVWKRIADYPGIARRGGVAFEIDGIGYYGTGQSREGYRKDFYKYDPALDQWFPIADFIGLARNAAVAFSYNSKAYVGTGHKVGEALKDFYMYDPLLDEWIIKDSVGGPIRQDAMAFCIDGKGYIGTGNDNLGNDFKDIWEYDFALDTWTRIEDFTGSKRRYAATFIIANTVYMAGGTDGTNLKDLWAYVQPLNTGHIVQEKIEFTLYPNPSVDKMTLHFNSHQNGSELTYTLTDLSGKIHQTHQPLIAGGSISKENLGSGYFILTIYSNGSVLSHHKLMFR